MYNVKVILYGAPTSTAAKCYIYIYMYMLSYLKGRFDRSTILQENRKLIFTLPFMKEEELLKNVSNGNPNITKTSQTRLL